jgi:hypothetical protein
VYKNWLLEKIFRQSGNDFAVMVVPIENGKPNYRDDLPLYVGLVVFSPQNSLAELLGNLLSSMVSRP